MGSIFGKIEQFYSVFFFLVKESFSYREPKLRHIIIPLFAEKNTVSTLTFL